MTRETEFPNFLILGATKSGTTSLHHYLKQHPEIYLPQEKETQFFIDDQLFHRGIEYYKKHYFSGVCDELAIGEATPLYFHRPAIVIPRLKASFPDGVLKFILLLRDPVSRAWSHYLHMRRLGIEPLEFEAAMAAESERIKLEPISWYSYFTDGLYGELLDQWFSAFSPEQFLIMTQDEFITDLDSSLSEVFAFLSVDTSVRIHDLSVKNEAGVARSKRLMSLLMGRFPGSGVLKGLLPLHFRRSLGMRLRHMNAKRADRPIELDGQLEQELRHRYVHDIERLELLLQRSFSSWKPG